MMVGGSVNGCFSKVDVEAEFKARLKRNGKHLKIRIACCNAERKNAELSCWRTNGICGKEKR